MKNNRRDFIKLTGSLAGLGLAGGGILKGYASELTTASAISDQNGNPNK